MDIDESVSGFEVHGDWGTVVELGERITAALRECDADDEALQEWEEWRPKMTDRIDVEMSEKTAAEASVGAGAGERVGAGAEADIETAGDKLTDSYEKVANENLSAAVTDARDSVGHVTRALDTAGRRALRSVEESIYENVMTQVSPYYFDNELISANLRSQNGSFVSRSTSTTTRSKPPSASCSRSTTTRSTAGTSTSRPTRVVSKRHGASNSPGERRSIQAATRLSR